MAPKASGPRQRLGGRSIRTRMLLIGWIPSLSLLLIGIILASVLAYNFWDLRRANLLVENNLDTTQAFVPEARRELLLSAAYLADPQAGTTELESQRARTDQALADIQADTAALSGSVPTDLETVFADFDDLIDQLDQTRQEIDAREATILEASEYWGSMIAEIADAVRALAAIAPDGEASLEESRAADLITVVEDLAVGNGLAYVAFSNEGLTDEEYQTFIRTGGTYRDDLEEIGEQLPTDEQAQLKEITSSQVWRQQAQVEQAVLGADELTRQEKRTLAAGVPAESLTVTDAEPTKAQLNNGKLKAELPIASSAWESANDEVTQALTDLALVHLDYSSGLAVAAADLRVSYAVYGGVFAVLFGVAVFLLTTRESGRLAARLRGLRDETLDLARNRLPGLIEELRVGEVSEKNQTMPRLSYGRDEIGEVAEAFNVAHEVAVGAAVQEAETRAGLREVFLNIAYRSQVIVHRQLGVLEKAERYEEDPEQLSLLFELDHLATRSRRNAENLVILGGGQPGRRWRNSVDLLQVVRSSISEAQDYTRVSLGRLPRLSIHGGAVADVIHLLAELVDNATSFSPPMSKVEVRGNLAGKGLVLEIEDQGLGIPADKLAEINAMLTAAPDFQALTLREEPRLGMFVVAQLAAGQNIRVTLTPSLAYGGTKAVVLIPAELFDLSPGGVSGGTRTRTPDGADTAENLDGVVSTADARSLHERMAITGEMTGEVTVLPTRSGTTADAKTDAKAGTTTDGKADTGADGSDVPGTSPAAAGAQTGPKVPESPIPTGSVEGLVRRDSFGSDRLKERVADRIADRAADLESGSSSDPVKARITEILKNHNADPARQRAAGSAPATDGSAGNSAGNSAGDAPESGSIRSPFQVSGAASEAGAMRHAQANFAPGASAPGRAVPEPGPVVNAQARADFLASRGAAGKASALPIRTPGAGSGKGVPLTGSAPAAAASPVLGADRSGADSATVRAVADGDGAQTRPALPRRVRQANLSDRLKQTPASTGDTGIIPTTGAVQTDPETARSRMSAFQRGTQRGRSERSAPDA